MSEHDTQVAFFYAVRFMENRHPELKWFHAIPNGGQRNKAVAAKLKAEGVQRGIPDSFLPYPANGKNGLYIEFKNGTNKLTPEQKEFLETAEQNGYAVGVAYTADEALKILEDYLGNLDFEYKDGRIMAIDWR